jgi:hypothetical protein
MLKADGFFGLPDREHLHSRADASARLGLLLLFAAEGLSITP